VGLAPYGIPRYADRIRQIIHVKEDGSYRLDMSYFGFFDVTYGPKRRRVNRLTSALS
jgi:hypothetical protein